MPNASEERTESATDPLQWSLAPVTLDDATRAQFTQVESRRDVARLVSLLPVLLGVHVVDVLAFGLRDMDTNDVVRRWERLTIASHALMVPVALVLWALAWRLRRRPTPAGAAERAVVVATSAAYVLFAAWLAGIDQLVTTAITPFAIGQLFAAVLLTLPRGAATVVHVGGCALLAFVLGHFQADPAMALSNTVNGLSMTLVAWGVGRLVAGGRARAFADRKRIEAQSAELRVVNAELHRLATHDPLTGLANRRWLMDQAESKASLASRQERPLHVLLVDVDHFKAVNDDHGHAAGDDVLRRLARVFDQVLRKSDVAGRLGGEEFAVIAPDTNHEGARLLAERIRKAVEESTRASGGPVVTVSVGLAPVTGKDAAAVANAFQQADDALYNAKRGGRNRVSSPPLRVQAG